MPNVRYSELWGKQVLGLEEEKAKELTTLVGAYEEFFIPMWGGYIQMRPGPMGVWEAVMNDTSGG